MHMYISGHKVQSLPTNMCRHTYITTDHMYINMILYIYVYTYSDPHLKKP